MTLTVSSICWGEKGGFSLGGLSFEVGVGTKGVKGGMLGGRKRGCGRECEIRRCG